MFEGLASSARQLLSNRWRAWLAGGLEPRTTPSVHAVPLAPLERVLITDGVGRTLFEQFASHRTSSNRDLETGWVLLGVRQTREAVALATLPAGLHSEASRTHVRFNSTAQALGSRIVRQADRRLTIVGVVHTHPGSLRHPSRGDLAGDRVWVEHLRGQEGVFAIGTADAPAGALHWISYQPRPNVQCLGELRLSWYSLRYGADAYRPLPLELTLGPDLARELHPAWPTLEEHAERIERLVRQQASWRIEVITGDSGPGLLLTLPLAEGKAAVRVALRGREVRYYVDRGGDVAEVHPDEDRVDRGVYLVLADLAAQG